MYLLNRRIWKKITRNVKRSTSSSKTLILLTRLYLRLFMQGLVVLAKLSPKEMKFENKEGNTEFNFSISSHSDKEGVSAILRVKNEETKILYCLKTIINVFDEIIFIDNASSDSTLELVKEFKRQYDTEEKIKIHHYPWKIARWGDEHLITPEDSLCSMVYYTNWTISHCSFKYVCKWDADMVLNKERLQEFRSFLRQEVLQEKWKCWLLGSKTVYRDLNGNYFLTNMISKEHRIFPYSYLNRYFKEEFWEVLRCAPPLPVEEFSGVAFYELKFSDEDEFFNWSTHQFSSSLSLLDRAEKEWKRLQLLREGRTQEDRFIPLSPDFLDKQVS